MLAVDASLPPKDKSKNKKTALKVPQRYSPRHMQTFKFQPSEPATASRQNTLQSEQQREAARISYGLGVSMSTLRQDRRVSAAMGSSLREDVGS